MRKFTYPVCVSIEGVMYHAFIPDFNISVNANSLPEANSEAARIITIALNRFAKNSIKAPNQSTLSFVQDRYKDSYKNAILTYVEVWL